jgi:hypothetical protein
MQKSLKACKWLKVDDIMNCEWGDVIGSKKPRPEFNAEEFVLFQNLARNG